jgi:multiple sugar transport system permease protein
MQQSQQTYDLRRRRILWGWVFLSPWIIGFLIFYLIPMAASLIFSFTDFNLIRPNEINWVGLRNWESLLVDPRVASSLLNTFVYSVIALPLTVVIPVLLASLLNQPELVGKRLLRTLFYMPFMIPTVAAAFIWAGFLNAETGWLNRFLALFGITGPNWLYDPQFIYFGLFMASLWGIGNAMLITLAGMQTVPTELYEAGRVDGASKWVLFRNITLPMISPVILYNLVLTVIGLFRFFDVPFMLKGSSGDPAGTTLFYNIYLYRVAFPQQNMGYGSALAWLLFIIALIVTLVIFLWARRWVYYSSGEITQ